MAPTAGRIDQNPENRVDQTVLFRGFNSGFQVGVNTGIITAELQLPPSLENLPFALGAVLDSYADQYDGECLEGTRTDVLQNIREWAFSPHERSIFWLQGMAGTGKSTISRSVARSFKDSNHLGASFFFKRGEGDRGNAKKFFPTLTNQLILKISGLRHGVQQALDRDPHIASKALREQFEKLLLQPLLNLDLDRLSQKPQTTVLVIDALDECEHDQDVRNIIGMLPLLQKAKALHLRIFLTSRPELPISLGFSEIGDHVFRDLALHEIPEQVTEHDIHLFLRERFMKIRHDKHISQDWPGDDVIQKLVAISVPLFISAATICRYIETSRLEPRSRLAGLLTDQAKYISRMDKTYLPILDRLFDNQDSDDSEQQQLLQDFQEIVGAIILLAIPLSINALSLFLGIGADQISNLLGSFRSVLNIPDNRDQPVRILHLSFRDFLVRSGTQFHIDEPKKHRDIARSCLKSMRRCLRKDICNVGSPGTRRADIDSQRIRHYLSPYLQYSCRYWVYHLEQSQASDLASEIGSVQLFLQKHLLHWVEVMSLLGLISEVVSMLNLLADIIPGDNNSIKARFLSDAKRFIMMNRQIADEAPLQIYYSGLLFAPRMATSCAEFQQDIPGWIRLFPQVNETWGDLELQTLEGHLKPIYTVTFSPDGRLLASSSADGILHLWDLMTGTLMQTLEASERLFSVTFSPNSRMLASGSYSGKVRLWDIMTGVLVHTFENPNLSCFVTGVNFSPDGRPLAYGVDEQVVSMVRLWDMKASTLVQTLEVPGRIYSMTFSPDGRLLASGSIGMVQLWDIKTGTLTENLEVPSGDVYSVIFSPDGHLLASFSTDLRVRIWDVKMSTLAQTLEVPGWLESMAFSPDSRLLACISDRIVQLWDIETGALASTVNLPLDNILTVAFSPDSRLLASGSSDRIVRLWEIKTGTLAQDLDVPSNYCNALSVTFSPDGRLLSSTSIDNVVLWDTANGTPITTLEGHSNSISSVAFSPDSRLLASVSDHMVRLWDTATGIIQQTLKVHEHEVRFVSFSPNGQLLASSSWEVVHLWNTETGALKHIFRPSWPDMLPSWPDGVQSIAFSPNGRLLASGFAGCMVVLLWDIETGALQKRYDGHSDWMISSMAFSPDSQLLAFSSDDMKVRLWDMTNDALQETLNTDEVVTRLEFSEDGSWLITNRGSLAIEPSSDHQISNSLITDPDIYIEGSWVCLNQQPVLWLPPGARPVCMCIRASKVAIGDVTGRVFFIDFLQK